jgi:hypothetical protein
VVEVNAPEESTPGFVREVGSECRRAVRTTPQRWLVAITLLLGLLAAVAVAATAQPADRTLATLSVPVQSLMSVTVPFIGILLVTDLRRARRRTAIAPTWTAAIVVAVVIALFGVVVCVLALDVTPQAAPGRWDHAAAIVVGGVLVQCLAELVGTGLGLLIRSPWIAFLASIVLPLGLWFALGAAGIIRPAQAWLTPYASLGKLLSGQMAPLDRAQWLVVLMIWGVGLNVVGARRVRRPTNRGQAS